MKNKIAILTFILISFVSQAQTHICRVDTIHVYSYITGTSAKELIGRTINQYNSSNLKTEELYQLRNTTSGVYSNDKVTQWSYDANGNQTSKLIQLWSTATNAWRNAERKFWTYDSNNQKTEEVKQYWNSSSGWVNNVKYNWTYNAFRKANLYTEYAWNTSISSWVIHARKNTTYNSSNNPIEDLTELWNATSSLWENYGKYTYSYDVTGKESENIWQRWNTTTMIWENDSKQNFDYNIQGQKIEEIISSWSNTTSQWVPTQKINWLYNANHNIIETETQLFSGVVWEKYVKETFEYNTSEHLIASETFSGWYEVGGYYVTRYRYENICSLIPTSIEEFENTEVKLFPNPLTSEMLHIDLFKESLIEIIDIQGKVVYRNVLNQGENQIQLSNLQPCIYVVKVGNSIQKLVKE